MGNKEMNYPTYPLMRCLTCGHLQTFSSVLIKGGRATGWCVGGHQAMWTNSICLPAYVGNPMMSNLERKE